MRVRLWLLLALVAAPAGAADLVVVPVDQDRIVIDVLSDTHCPVICGENLPPRCPSPPCLDHIACCDTFRAIVENQNLRPVPKDFTFLNGDVGITTLAVVEPWAAERFYRYWNQVPGAKAYGLGNHEADAAPDSAEGVQWMDDDNHFMPANAWEPLFDCVSKPTSECRRWHSVHLGSPPRVAWLTVNNTSDDVADAAHYPWCMTPNDRLNHASSAQRQWLNAEIDALPPTVEVVFVAGHRTYYGVENFSHRPNIVRSLAWGSAPPETLRTGAVSFLRDLESVRDRAPNVKRVFMISGDQHCFSETAPIRHDVRDDERGVVYITLGISGGWINRGLWFPAIEKIPPGTLVHAFRDKWGSVRFEVWPDCVTMNVHEAYTDSLIHRSLWPLETDPEPVAAPGPLPVRDGPVLRAWPNPSVSGRVQMLFEPATTQLHAPLAEASVHDAAGRRVRALVPDAWSRGAYRFEWDGRDEEGRAVASGRYFVRVRQTGAPGAATPVTILRQP